MQATQAGGRVRVRLTEQVDNVVVAVEDNGCGMDAETQQQVFDPFSRISSPVVARVWA
ncbi:MAG UNVERIFIED_CONTAM: ATP-binding protein [Planctomycetaceae bacterium]